MAVSKKDYDFSLPVNFKGKEIPHDYIIKFDYTSFRPERRSLAKRQITNLYKKMELHAHIEQYCIEQINKIILVEIGELENE